MLSDENKYIRRINGIESDEIWDSRAINATDWLNERDNLIKDMWEFLKTENKVSYIRKIWKGLEWLKLSLTNKKKLPF